MMTKIICLLNKVSNKKLTIFILTLVLSMTSLELAWSTPQPQPQPIKNTPSKTNQQAKQSERQPTKDTGSKGAAVRGCGEDGEISLRVLGSRNYFEPIVSTRPTFAWFVPDSKPVKTKIRIYKQLPNKQKKQFGDDILLSSTQGIMTLSPFSDKVPELEVGGKYLFQVVMMCDPNSRSADLEDTAYFEVENIPVSLQKALDNAGNNPAKRAAIYADAGFLQDALSEALKLTEKSKLGKLGADILQKLIKEEEQPEDIENVLNILVEHEQEKPEKPEEFKSEKRKLIEERISDLKQIAVSQQ
ncbi:MULTISPECIES: DUF928 domain-containing protein [unclassified Dolichospermum]|uniref:DUF928 domain-containing protein n=1 Tax=unclassified Dolichospermum TaxID=2622029 RepID=UPI001445B69E|nr:MULTISPECIES: DUF928 domain-containing protein [unclassified Dolichospermum]MTJ15839.1 DUF928 domain-containing protein [Dolichospermum sp. UHCC 0299]MTJ41608.1 DUF928 domain-containing protein [Dolichospermum sp. UHCC 0406]